MGVIILRFMGQEWKLKHGRHRKIETREELDYLLEEYFNNDDNRPFTMRKVALHLGLSSMDALSKWYKVPQFVESLQQAKLICESQTEDELHNEYRKNVQGIIFSLKNNYGWSDKQEIVSTNTNKNTNVNYNKSVDEMTEEELQEELKKLESEEELEG